jgi:DNA gyrase/topoisomerase IV subunit B
VNPRFDTQTKSKCVNVAADLKDFVNEKELEDFTKKIVKNKEITDPILEMFVAKEAMKHAKTLTSMENVKKFKSDKYLAPIGQKKYLALCEGASAKGGLSAVLGRNEIGYYELKGVPLNTYEVSITKILDNQEFEELIKILGLRLAEKESTWCNYQSVLFATDADLDGQHIQGILLAFFEKYARWMFDMKMIKRLKTPVIVLKEKDKIKHFFFTMDEYNEFAKKHNTSKFDLKYMKGLGSWKKEELDQIVKDNGLDFFIESYVHTDGSNNVLKSWLSKDTVEDRKEMLRVNKFNIFSI